MTWEVLNAYVDGELDRAMSAQVAAAAAEDVSVAARIASLSKLKAHSTKIDIPTNQIPPLPNDLKRRGRSSWRPYAIAAGLAMVLTAGLLVQSRLASNASKTWLDVVLVAQRQWLNAAAHTKADDRGIVTIGAATGTRLLDLSDAQLKLVYAAPMPPLAGGDATFLGYRGPHGCMVGLWIGAPQAGLGAKPQAFDDGDVRVRAWGDLTTGYALLAKGMDPNRIDQLAEAVARLVDPAQIVDDSVRTALRDVTRTGVACRV